MEISSILQSLLYNKLTSLQEEIDNLYEIHDSCNCSWMLNRIDFLTSELTETQTAINQLKI